LTRPRHGRSCRPLPEPKHSNGDGHDCEVFAAVFSWGLGRPMKLLQPAEATLDEVKLRRDVHATQVDLDAQAACEP
jgi:hypothetical protein